MDTPKRSRDPDAYPAVLHAAEAAQVRLRRQAAGDDARPVAGASTDAASALPPNALGVGLSGGGVRSATFCLGIFQALAEARLVRRVDFLSTVSGGGYFGSFLGRLFTRSWIGGVDDVERVLQGIDPASARPDQRWGARVFRWLRDNSRYLAPRGSGDLLVLGAVLLRNWLAVQLVLVTTVVTVFVGLQLGRVGLERVLGMTDAHSGVGSLLMCELPGGTWLWWSPWILVAALPFLLVAVPNGWAYWMVNRDRDGRRGVPAWIGLLAVTLLGFAGMLHYRNTTDLSWLTSWIPQWVPASPGSHDARLLVSTIVGVTGLLTLARWRFGEAKVRGSGSNTDTGNQVRSLLSRGLKTGLVLTAGVAAWSAVDTVGGTLFALARASQASLGNWSAAAFAAFAGLGAFARQLALLLAPTKGGARPRIVTSILMWASAIGVGVLWLVAVNVTSHAIAWDFREPRGVPPALSRPSAAPPVLGVDQLRVEPSAGGFVVIGAANDVPLCTVTPVQRYGTLFPWAALGILAAFTLLFGRTHTFANLSSIHTFYAARLTRTYLGASNEARLKRNSLVTETTAGDDAAGEDYWDWPLLSGPRAETPHRVRSPQRGGPLHLINSTINETVDVRSGVQNQDRKGTILAVGPCGLSVGIRHHLVTTPKGVAIVPADPGPETHRVFRSAREGATTPDPLSLGQWMSVSGAAFSAAAGTNTSVPVAILAGLFNVRLGYWWDSGTPAPRGAIERLLPVQSALFAELLAQTTGTAGSLWNLSDGGHFENLAGYELIRRRLPVILIVDAEADPDYTFSGLSDLVRKARLDFEAEITFLSEAQLSDSRLVNGVSAKYLPESLRPLFGDLNALRRGMWTTEEMPFPAADKRFSLEVDRSRVSRAHAALARVDYLDDGGGTSWLVYVKATLMGDEPEDVVQYHRAHPEFPQETTTDQFFDEAQWESYRRLGLHVGRRVLTEELLDHLKTNPA